MEVNEDAHKELLLQSQGQLNRKENEAEVQRRHNGQVETVATPDNEDVGVALDDAGKDDGELAPSSLPRVHKAEEV